ncbi:hypothetical protein FBQ87_06580 [Sphingobacteriales bacterium CHB3]|nr:hypothetical protein [Sphingobacteriales bacterium CHB3]
MLTGKQNGRIAAREDTLSEGNSQKEDLEFAISMLKVKLHSATALSEKIRLYNQIKTLQDNISKLSIESSARS